VSDRLLAMVDWSANQCCAVSKTYHYSVCSRERTLRHGARSKVHLTLVHTSNSQGRRKIRVTEETVASPTTDSTCLDLNDSYIVAGDTENGEVSGLIPKIERLWNDTENDEVSELPV